MATLPKWLVPVGLAAGVVAAVLLARKPPLKAGDVIAVRKETLRLSELQLAAFPAAAEKAALRVASEANGQITGQLVGWIDPVSKIPVDDYAGAQVQGVPRSAVTDHYRDDKRIG